MQTQTVVAWLLVEPGIKKRTKRLDRGRFIWPATVDGLVSLTAAQMSYLLETIDWRNPQHTWRPQSAG